MHRRSFLNSVLVPVAGAAVGVPGVLVRAGRAHASGWRRFEVTTKVEVADPSGVTRAWVPLPLMTDTDYQKRMGDTWTGNAAVARVHRDAKYDAGFLYAEWPATEKAPVIEVVSRFATRDRATEVGAPNRAARKASRAELERALEPTRYLPTDGIVKETAEQITRGMTSDVDRARAIYEWIVENTFRDPEVRGCGLGDIKTMLETRYFGGKCADLNALYVGLARAAGLPARDVYGVRVADSREFKSLGKSGDISRAQHCRAEVHLADHGWVAVDPADVRKVVLEEPPAGRTLSDPLVQKARAKLFGSWEMNWLAYNYAHDVKLPHSAGEPVPFLMYPQAETGAGERRDSLEPASFKYQITSRELTS